MGKAEVQREVGVHCMYINVGAFTCAPTDRDKKWTLVVFLYCSWFYRLETTWLAGHEALRVLLSLPQQFWGDRHV